MKLILNRMKLKMNLKGSAIAHGFLSRQYAEKYMLFLQFSAGGLHDWGILLVIHLEFQEIKHQPFSMTQPEAFALSMSF